MITAGHILVFLLSASILWFFAGMVLEATVAVADHYNRSGFTVAFFVLGFLTSIGEVSIMVNSVIDGVPEVAAGNIVGASLVILFFILPLLAILGNGVRLRDTLGNKELIFALLVVPLPALFVLDGSVGLTEGLLCLLSYGTLFYLIEGRKWDLKSKLWWIEADPNSVSEVVEEVEEELVDKKRVTYVDFLKIVTGAIFIFLAGNLLVWEVDYFSTLLNVPGSIIALLVLSVGTNIPELVVAIQSVRKDQVNIAFGNYLGSSVANVLAFGIMVLLTGSFFVETSAFVVTAALMVGGLIAFYIFAQSKNDISRKEGFALISIYGIFLIYQITSLILV